MIFFRPLISVNEEDTCLGVLPFFHIYGLSPVMMGVLQDGGKLVTQPRFDPEMFLKALQGYKVSFFKVFIYLKLEFKGLDDIIWYLF